MKILMNEILTFQTFYDKINSKKLPIKTAYKFAKFFSRVNEELKFYQDQLIKISQEYCEYNPDGTPVLLEGGGAIKIKEDKIAECQAEMQKLLNLEVEIPDVFFTLDELDGTEMTLDELYPIMKFIQE